MSVIKPALEHPNLITHLLGANNYCWIYYRNGDKKLLAKPISYLQDELPGFIRTHKSVLINPIYARTLTAPPRQKMAGEIQLESGLIFPVSRRRWNEVAEALDHRLAADAEKASAAVTFTISSTKKAPSENVSKQSILLVTDDPSCEPIVTKMMSQRWPQYRLQIAEQSNQLPDHLAGISAEELPTLILLDARTTTVERLQTLQRLKRDPYLCRIPVILFVTPADTLISDGYKRQANSVISLQDGQLSFVQTIERVCRFWLQTASLPSLPKPSLTNK
ncbi:LytTR family transcriptional regulator DNA-binding domain-containing protein [Spirosoma fluviale]|uniref:LytTr DNA-binding domain-containing protein n=1 Tax=Spirosoma fluviale TaxID=1597977 RepID=A0A286G963_9BACT|nr:LytTR family transcriptional regulator DNA-binding domain-containing protein [Spirosoma fluviale]SOD92012.1 LytTr DNA-binding domain-containing protein [Spirosoma fluviale]